ncbi:MAG TPA: GTP cyclohydrolase I FolE [Verrucomicrobiae bacterium]|nr:GTP cyclohydrolase I FolE [Verrucomicrobiae bacterium]
MAQHTIDKKKIREAVRLLLEAIGEDPDREGLQETPDRVARMYEEIFGQGEEEPRVSLSKQFDEQHHEVVLVKDIPFFSMCEHHLMPFFGKAHVAYIPNGHVVGISKLARVVESFARRPQVQERLTSQIADIVNEELRPKGVAVVCEAVHTCMTMRGVKKPGSSVITSAMRGAFQRNVATRTEIMALIYGQTPA